MPIVDAGETYSWRVRVTDSTGLVGAPGAPPTVTVTYPDGTAAPATTVTFISLGVYDVDWATSSAIKGLHRWQASATGGVLGTATRSWGGVFDVRDPAQMLVDTSEALSHLRAVGIIVSPDDWDQLRWLCAVASEAVEIDLHRTFMRQTVVEERSASDRVIYLRKSPVISVTSVVVDGVTTADPATYRLDSNGAVRSRFGWLSVGWPGTVTITYIAGSSTPPMVVRKVALNTVQRMWQQSQEADHPALEASDETLGSTVATGELTSVEFDAYNTLRAKNL